MMSSEERGLSHKEVQERIERGEVNRVEKFTTRTIPAILCNNTLTIFNGILLISVIALFIIRAHLDAFFLMAVTFGNMLLGIIQELRAKSALDKLSLLQRKEADVIREGKRVTINIEDAVKDDVVELKAGQQVIADGILLSESLSIDESSLTGEQDPVDKHKGDLLFSSCTCLSGSGRYRITHIGNESHINKLTAQAKEYKFFATPLQKEINHLIQGFTCAMILFVILLLMAHFIKDLSVTSSLLAIVTMIKSLVPQGLVLISTLALALGAYRSAKQHVLVQKMNAIESMSHMTTLCLDKTGTLCTSQLRFESVIALESTPEQVLHHLRQFIGAITSKNLTTEAIERACPPIISKALNEIPFSSAYKYSAVSIAHAGAELSLWLGVPEVLALNKLTEDHRKQLKSLREQGLRVLLLAHSSQPLPEKETLAPLAFIVLSNELRADVKEAIRFFELRHVRLRLLSGDHPDTVFAIAKQAGITIKGSVVSGPLLENLSPHDFEKAVNEGQFFGSLHPRQKQLIIKHLQARGEYVCMVGDGVNDIFALKQADIGVAMNSGVSSARELADIILLKDAFTHLPSLSREGDRIIYNIKRVSKLFLTKNIYSIFFVLFVGFIGLEFPLSPRFITWIDFITVGLPTTLLTLMTPMLSRQSTKHFTYNLLKFAVPTGIVIAIYSLFVFANFTILQHRSELYGKTASTAVLILLALYVVYLATGAERAKKESAKLKWEIFGIIAMGVLLLLPAIYWSPLRELIGMAELNLHSWIPILIATFLGIVTIRLLLRKVMN